MTFHSQFRQGQKVIVHFKDGAKKIGKFYGRKSRTFVIRDDEPRYIYCDVDQIRQVSIYKLRSNHD